HGPQARLRFAPKIAQHDFRCLFTAGDAWGSIAIHGPRAVLAVLGGQLRLRILQIADRVHTFDPPKTVSAGQVLEIG
ncbi:MAG TPA: hypothetical protein VN648_18415, partial [Candidatus Methylomirabilis sp.]|nr:hypothetical protein [Candidatus Methylomirabilis sp.]